MKTEILKRKPVIVYGQLQLEVTAEEQKGSFAGDENVFVFNCGDVYTVV